MRDRSGQAIAIALEWVGRIFAVVLLMWLPGWAGGWLDRRWGTHYLEIVGFVVGLVLGMGALIAMTRAADAARRAKRDANSENNHLNGADEP